MRILITGDRDWGDFERIYEILEQLPEGQHTLIHGTCRGVDSLAAIAAGRLGWNIEEFRPDWEQYGRAAGPVRNQLMVDAAPDIAIAFHTSIRTSRGTKDCVIRARNTRIPVWLVTKDEVRQVVRAAKQEVLTRSVVWKDICDGLRRVHS